MWDIIMDKLQMIFSGFTFTFLNLSLLNHPNKISKGKPHPFCPPLLSRLIN